MCILDYFKTHFCFTGWSFSLNFIKIYSPLVLFNYLKNIITKITDFTVSGFFNFGFPLVQPPQFENVGFRAVAGFETFSQHLTPGEGFPCSLWNV